VHTYAGEADAFLDHETMEWARTLKPGDKVKLRADPPIPAVVKSPGPGAHASSACNQRSGHR